MKIAIWAVIVFVATFVVALTALHAGHQQGRADGYAERDKEFVKNQAQLHESTHVSGPGSLQRSTTVLVWGTQPNDREEIRPHLRRAGSKSPF